MSENPRGYGPPKLEGFSVKVPSPSAAGPVAAAPLEQKIQLVIQGEGFMDRALPLIITIGDLWVTTYQVATDGRSVTCFLDRMPAEGAPIRVGYTVDGTIELPQRFSRSDASGGGHV